MSVSNEYALERELHDARAALAKERERADRAEEERDAVISLSNQARRALNGGGIDAGAIVSAVETLYAGDSFGHIPSEIETLRSSLAREREAHERQAKELRDLRDGCFRMRDGRDTPACGRCLPCLQAALSKEQAAHEETKKELGHALASEKQMSGYLEDQTIRANKFEAALSREAAASAQMRKALEGWLAWLDKLGRGSAHAGYCSNFGVDAATASGPCLACRSRAALSSPSGLEYVPRESRAYKANGEAAFGDAPPPSPAKTEEGSGK